MGLTVACVLRPSKTYRPEHVRRLHDQCQHYLPPHDFIAFSSVSIPGISVIPLEKDWPGWWAKLELFLPSNYLGPTLYFDLDTTINRPIHWIHKLLEHPITGLQDFYHPQYLGSGIMTWTIPHPHIPEGFSPALIPQWTHYPKKYGDQSWIFHKVPDIKFIQPLIPQGSIQSFKQNPNSPDILVYHGHPKPWT